MTNPYASITPNRTGAGYLLSARLYKNLAVLLSGTVVAQAVNILASPILTRLYSPDAFGLFGLYTAVGMVLSLPAALRYDVAVPLPKEDDEAGSLMQLAFLCLGAVTLSLAAGLLVLYATSTFTGLALGNHWSWLWFVPAVVFARGSYIIATSWAMRNSFFRDITTSRISQPLITTGAQIATALVGLEALGLVGGQFLGQAAASVILIALLARRASLPLWRKVDLAALRRIARAYSHFPKYSVPQSFVSQVSQYIPIFVFARFFDTAFVGYYTLMSRVVQLPATIVGQAVREAFLPQLADAHRHGQAYQELRRMVGLLALVGGIPALMIVPFAPALFAWVFGPEWRVAGVYAQIVAPYIVTGFVIPPVAVAMYVLRQQRWHAGYELVQGILALAATVIGGLTKSSHLALALYAAVGVAAHLALMRRAFRIAKEAVQAEG